MLDRFQIRVFHSVLISDLVSGFSSYKQLLDEVFVISRIIKVEVRVIPYRDLDYSGYHKNRI